LTVPAIPETLLIFGGRRWKIMSVDAPSRTLILVPAPAGRPPQFDGAPVGVSSLIRGAMRAILASNDVPPYLDAAAQSELVAARGEFAGMGLNASSLYAEQSGTWIAAWASDAALTTLKMALKQHGIEAVNEDAFLKVDGCTPDELIAELTRLDAQQLPSVASLLGTAAFPPEQKFDRFVAEALLRESFGVRHLDRDEARTATRAILQAGVPQTRKSSGT
jgi:ATP-dependent Lhr-like helicase